MNEDITRSYRFSVPDEKSKYELSELAKMFIPEKEFVVDISGENSSFTGEYDLNIDADSSKNDKKRQLYFFLSEKTGKTLDWGILTGVRPSKLFRELEQKIGYQETIYRLHDEYLVSDEKIALLEDVYCNQNKVLQDTNENAVGIYVGIPFCPSRCLYCAFTSNKITKDAAIRYMAALRKEILFVSDLLKQKGLYAESIYIGGGTPTSLDEEDFEALLSCVCSAFRTEKTKEFTVEAGRPDTITEGKLALIKQYDIDRISINPQTMKGRTLELIGRSHTPEQIKEAFALAEKYNIEHINADLIAGLPEEDVTDFTDSLKQVIDLDPTNITVHTLSVKKASRLIEEDPEYNRAHADAVRKMLESGKNILKEHGYEPYYMYRQKHMAGNFENVGYCKNGTASVYNIRIMEENQTIIALGAGGISKVYYPLENRLERVPNVSNYEIYIDRIDEMCERKRKGIE